eukprot:6983108-Prorocentrum_lima.AAC.1
MSDRPRAAAIKCLCRHGCPLIPIRRCHSHATHPPPLLRWPGASLLHGLQQLEFGEAFWPVFERGCAFYAAQ